MTDLPLPEFTVTVLHEDTTLAVCVGGELDHDTSAGLVDTVVQHLTAEPVRLSDVRLDFRDLTWIDSTGLSALLMIHRRTTAVGATLHLDRRPDFLDRRLRLTNVLDHLTAQASRADPHGHRENDGCTGAGAT
ncbi:sulfate transporter [Streptomyces filipinensis]|uniref:Sulfate transporter n=1 Tax=Streptomyces filipinensis TaxID=66887 RepID=A0A918MEJ5_9ACTN|nr:STAS domain-containing protein [Streptomyces filipinensis]GGV15981.1 sulfate transporter [Streptomyces filipinensis]